MTKLSATETASFASCFDRIVTAGSSVRNGYMPTGPVVRHDTAAGPVYRYRCANGFAVAAFDVCSEIRIVSRGAFVTARAADDHCERVVGAHRPAGMSADFRPIDETAVACRETCDAWLARRAA